MAGENEDKGGESTEQTGREPVVSNELSAEIDGAVTSTVEQIERERKERSAATKKDELPPAEDHAGDEPGGDKPLDGSEKSDEGSGKAGDPPAITDALVERAVKAGMSISDARSFQNADALERLCVMLEKRTAGDGGGAGAGKKAEGDGSTEEEDPADAIPDLDPEKYDENVVAGFKAMKEIIRGQHQTIKGMRGEGEARQVSWFDGQVAALGKGFEEALGTGDRAKLDPNGPQAKKRGELQAKVDVLTAGYKAAGQDVSREAVFQEAVAIVLGDVKAKAEATVKADELGRRRSQHINRASGNVRKPTTDAFADVADKLDQKYFGKK